MSFAKILVALDRSSLESIVWQQAIDLARSQPAELLLVHFISQSEAAPASPYVETRTAGWHPTVGLYQAIPGAGRLQETQPVEQSSIWQETETWLQRYCQQAIARGIAAECNCLPEQGELGAQICELAEGWNADLIVLGRKGRTGIAEAVMGSTSNYVFHHAPCSVLIVQGENAP